MRLIFAKGSQAFRSGYCRGRFAGPDRVLDDKQNLPKFVEKVKDIENLLREAFAISENIRYVAVYDNGALSMRQRADINNVSSGESDKYEELLVNPVLIKLASQRGNIDCGGLEYLIIRYGNFFVLLIPCINGHINFGIEPGKDPLLLVGPVNGLLAKYEMK